jgi:Fe-S-cluster-containing dehydrogenase component
MRNGLLIDYEWCTGCHSCEVACKAEHGYGVGEWGIHVLEDGPWQVGDDPHNWVWNKVPVPSKLCDLCAERVAKGREPSCVHHCLAQVMKFGPLDELVLELDKKPNQVLFVPEA